METGIPKVGEQHRSLFRQVDELLDPTKQDRVPAMFDFLGKYVVMHFKTEELMQKASKYPKAQEHKKLHDAFVIALSELRKEFDREGGSMLILMKITKIALDWLNTHIRGADRDFAEFFRASGLDGSRVSEFMRMERFL